MLKQALWKLQFRAKGKKFREHQVRLRDETDVLLLTACAWCVADPLIVGG